MAMSRWMCKLLAGVNVIAVTLAPSIVRADPVSDFYKGRQVRFVIGSNTGGA